MTLQSKKLTLTFLRVRDCLWGNCMSGLRLPVILLLLVFIECSKDGIDEIWKAGGEQTGDHPKKPKKCDESVVSVVAVICEAEEHHHTYFFFF